MSADPLGGEETPRRGLRSPFPAYLWTTPRTTTLLDSQTIPSFFPEKRLSLGRLIHKAVDNVRALSAHRADPEPFSRVIHRGLVLAPRGLWITSQNGSGRAAYPQAYPQTYPQARIRPSCDPRVERLFDPAGSVDGPPLSRDWNGAAGHRRGRLLRSAPESGEPTHASESANGDTTPNRLA